MDDAQSPSGDFGDAQRRLAALLAELTAETRYDEQTLRELAGRERTGLLSASFEHMAGMMRDHRDGLELLRQIAAAQAIAYDDMIAAGGPDNPEAAEQFRKTTERLMALMPRFGATT